MRGQLLIVALALVAVMVATATPVAAHSAKIDVTHLAVGTTVTKPTVGGLWTCQTSFSGGGAQTAGPWFNNDGTYDATKKYTVDGTVSWPNAVFTVTRSGTKRVFTGNDLPTDHATGTFPIASTAMF